MSATIATHGPGIPLNYARFMGEFCFGLVCLWLILIGAGFAILGPRVKRLISLVRDPLLLAASSAAAYPKMLEQLAKFPIPRKISTFVLPLGYPFNLDGTMRYCTFASEFIAQAYDIPLSLPTRIAMLLTLMRTSKGVAGVPRASLVVIAATLSQFGLPEEGLLLSLGIDTFLDKGRSATNVTGNSLATAVVAKWEGQLMCSGLYSRIGGSPLSAASRASSFALADRIGPDQTRPSDPSRGNHGAVPGTSPY